MDGRVAAEISILHFSTLSIEEKKSYYCMECIGLGGGGVEVKGLMFF